MQSSLAVVGSGRNSPVSCSSSEASPKSNGVVNVCKNCSFSYRLSRRNTADFCSKGNLISCDQDLFVIVSHHVLPFFFTDCQTNRTLFGACTPSKPAEKTAAEVRTSIYEFQQRMDADYSNSNGNNTSTNDNFSSLDEASKPSSMVLPNAAEGINAQEFPVDLLVKKEKKVKSSKSRSGTFFDSLFNASPMRSVRPQLHAFI